jgi:hypothetical protein
MPAHKAQGKGKKSFNKAVGENMHELSKPGSKKRSQAQKVAIAMSEARGKKKK